MEKIGDLIQKQKAPLLAKDKGAFVRFNVSAKVLREGFTQIPNVIIDDYALDSQEKAILMALYRHAYGQNHCYPSHKLIGQEAGCNKRSVVRKLKSLRSKGYVSWQKTSKFNTYALKISIPRSFRSFRSF
jgi:hypothetical protein